MVTGVLEVRVEEALREIAPPTMLQVHHRERNVADDIDPAHALVELDAVEKRDLVVDERNVPEVQVAVAFAHEPGRAPRLPGGAPGSMLPPRPALEGFEIGEVGGAVDPRAQLGEVGQRHVEHLPSGTPGLAGASARRARMEARDGRGQRVDVRRRERPAREQCRQQRVLRKLAHLQRPFEHRACTADDWPLDAAGDGHDVEIEPGGGASIEPQLLLAVTVPGLESREVEEPEVDRFLDLPGVGARQVDPGDVRLDDAHRRAFGAEARRIAQCRREPLLQRRCLVRWRCVHCGRS